MWKQSEVSQCKTYHCIKGAPLYKPRFSFVQKFHEPGLAPVVDQSGAYHICLHGDAAYKPRFLKTYGFYCNRAAVLDETGAYHITPIGEAAYTERYAWCGNYQSDMSVVKNSKSEYYHIHLDGKRLYANCYQYVGDFRDGYAVVFEGAKQATHINRKGEKLHGYFFEDLDVYHKGYARAKDHRGWFHIDMSGRPIYSERFAQVEPFYNDVALVEKFDEAKVTINVSGEVIATVTPAVENPLHALSAEMVSFWKCETLFSASELGVFSHLPGTVEKITEQTAMPAEKAFRLMRALWELDLVHPVDKEWHLNSKGELLLSPWVESAARMWRTVQRQCWCELSEALQNPLEKHFPTFKELEEDTSKREVYLEALDGYAIEELKDTYLNLDECRSLAVTGRASLPIISSMERMYPDIKIEFFAPKLVSPKSRKSTEIVNYLKEWPVVADALLMTKFLHYWPDAEVREILKRAKESAKKKLFLIEFTLSNSSPGGSLLDLNMLVESGGKERTQDQILNLLESVDLKLYAKKRVGWGCTLYEVHL